MILWAGVAFWALAVALMWQVAAGGGSTGRLIADRRGTILAGLLLLLSGLFCFRPEEIIFSGEDPGAYINTAVELKSQGNLFYRDALYGELSERQKQAFRYGHSGFGLTKDAALWIKDLPSATMGSWFQPAYPLMMGAAAWVLPDYVVFLVVPLFAIMNAVLLALLAHYLTGRRLAGLFAFLFYLLNPVMAWNARCPRPEVIASFFVLAGIFLLVRMIRGEDAFTFRRSFLVGLALALAPLLHITALFVLAPTMMLFLCLAPYRFRGWAGWWTAVVIGGCLLVLEIRHVTDCYSLWRFIGPVGSCAIRWVPIAGLATGVVVLGLASWGVRQRIRTVTSMWRLVLGTGASILAIAACAYIYFFRSRLGALPFLPEVTSAYLSLTDLKGIVMLLSWPLVLAALAGGIAMLVHSDERWSARFLLFIVLFPSVMTIGWMTHYMFETRRAVLTLVPVMTLGLACGLIILGGSSRGARVGWALLAAIVLLVWPIPSRLFLYTTWSLKGTYGFYRELAAVVKQEKGIIVGEYTPLVSPFEHLFGIPVLSIDTAHRSDEEVGVAADAVAGIVRRHPDRTVFLVTPFSQPVIVGVTLDPVLSRAHQARTLGRETGRIPAGAKTSSVELHLFRVRLLAPGERVVLPFVRQMDEGRMGCTGLSKQMPSRAVIWSGIACPASKPIDVRWEVTNGIAASEIYLFFSGDGSVRPGGRIISEGSDLEAQWYPLGSDWCVARLPARTGAPLSGVRVEAASDLVLIQVSALVGSGSSRLSVAGITTDNACKTSIASESRWLRQNSMLDLPDGQPTGLRLLVLSRGDRDGRDAVRVNVTRKGDLAAACLDTLTDWSWSVLSFPAREDPQAQDHFLLSSETAWDSGKSGFPSDLGFRLSRVVVLPALP